MVFLKFPQLCSKSRKFVENRQIFTQISNNLALFTQVPDAPIWLLSRNRPEAALKALQWLRGWVAPSAVQNEFEQLQKYKDRSHACNECTKQDTPCAHSTPTISKQISSLFRREALHPLIMVVFMFFIAQFTGLDAMRIYLVQIMVAYGVPFDPNWAIVSLMKSSS